MTFNVNVNLNESKENSKLALSDKFSTSEFISREKALTKEEIAQEFKKGTLVDAGDGNGGTIHARLICRASGTTTYYSDTRKADGKLEIGKELKNYTVD